MIFLNKTNLLWLLTFLIFSLSVQSASIAEKSNELKSESVESNEPKSVEAGNGFEGEGKNDLDGPDDSDDPDGHHDHLIPVIVQRVVVIRPVPVLLTLLLNGKDHGHHQGEEGNTEDQGLGSGSDPGPVSQGVDIDGIIAPKDEDVKVFGSEKTSNDNDKAETKLVSEVNYSDGDGDENQIPDSEQSYDEIKDVAEQKSKKPLKHVKKD